MASMAPEDETKGGAALATMEQPKEQPVEEDDIVELPTVESSLKLKAIRQSAMDVTGMAIQSVIPDAETAAVALTENGFHVDISSPSRPITEADIKQIQKAVDKIIKKNYPMRHSIISRQDAINLIASSTTANSFLNQVLESIPETDPIALVEIGTPPSSQTNDGEEEENEKRAAPYWWTLGPVTDDVLESTGKIPKKSTIINNVAGAYWQGDESQAMLQRVYGTAWETPAQLKAHKALLQEAKKRDHRMLGQKLDLFSIQEDAGGGLVFWHPKGAAVRQKIEEYWKEMHIQDGYDMIYTPHIANLNLWKTSGHADFYIDDMFDQMDVENDQYQIKPMNCPFHCLMYKDSVKSYRDLPVKWGELGTVYRYERSGTLHGLMRVRGFTQDDAHIFCLPEQLQDEIIGVLELTQRILTRFGFDQYELMLSTRPDKSVGSDDIWTAATDALEGALKAKGWKYSINEGDGAFYGPKIDLKIRDAIGRSWQLSTVQCDFNLPERFDLEYVSAEGTKERPIMVHRAIFGSLERFFGILVENCAGDFPQWLAPVQFKLLPVTSGVMDYCREVQQKAKAAGIRVQIDRGTERLAKQIRNAEQGERIPLMAVVGNKEMETDTLAIRSRQHGDLGSFDVTDFITKLVDCNEQTKEFDYKGTTTTEEKKE